MILLLIVVVGVIALATAAVWLLKRRIATMGAGLPGALDQWQKEIEKLEKPKG